VGGIDNEGQWIIMMGFLVSLGIFFLAIVISQSTLVGQTTAEGVLEFPKNDIQDLRHDVLLVEKFEREGCGCSTLSCQYDTAGCDANMTDIRDDVKQIYLYRKSAIVNITMPRCNAPGLSGSRTVGIHYNNGVTAYDEYPITIYCSVP
jgi:hypothetical protein